MYSIQCTDCHWLLGVGLLVGKCKGFGAEIKKPFAWWRRSLDIYSAVVVVVVVVVTIVIVVVVVVFIQ